MGGARLCCIVLLATTACASDAREPRVCPSDSGEPGELLSGELIGSADGESFPVRYGALVDWDRVAPPSARLHFQDGPYCDGCMDGDHAFSAWTDMEVDPQSDQDYDDPYTIHRWASEDLPRLSLEFKNGQLHFDRVDEYSVSGYLSWGGPRDRYDRVFALEGTFEVERCYAEFSGD